MKLAQGSALLLLLAAVSVHAQETEVEPSDDMASESTETPPVDTEIGSAESDIFETVSDRMQQEVEAGNLDPDLARPDADGSEIGSADSDLFETVSDRMQRELEAGNLDPDLGESDGSEPGQTEEATADDETVIGEVADQPATPEEQQELDEQAYGIEHPFGHPDEYPVDPDDEPLPQKGDAPVDPPLGVQQEWEEQADQVDQFLGDPAQYPVDPDAEPLPQEADPPVDSDSSVDDE